MLAKPLRELATEPRVRNLIAALFLISIPPIFFWRETSGQRTLGDRDAVFWFFPAYKFVAEQIKSGSLPLWNPYQYSGAPMFAEWQAGALDPINWIYLIETTSRALTLSLEISFALALLATFSYARSLGFNRRAAVVSAVVYGLSGFAVGRALYPGFLRIVALAPFVLYFVEKLYKQGRWRHVAGGALIVAWQVFAAHPQPLIYSSLLACAYALFCAFLRRDEAQSQISNLESGSKRATLGDGLRHVDTETQRENHKEGWRRLFSLHLLRVSVSPRLLQLSQSQLVRSRVIFLAKFTLMFAGGACLSAAQLLPAAEFASQSVRREWPFELFTLHSLHPLSLLTALFPFFHGEGRGIYRMPYWGVYWHQNEAQIYLGVIALSLAIAGAVFVWRARWGVGMFWVCVAVIGIVLALGKYAGPLASALYHVPVVGAFRSPNRHWMEVALGVAVLSGYAVDRLLGDKSLPLARAARIASLSLAAVCVAVGAIVLWRKDWAEAVVRTLSDLGSASPGVFRAAGPEFYLPMITSLCAMAVIMIFTRSRRRGQWFALLLAALIIDYHLYAVFAPIASPAGLETLVGTAMPRALAAKQSEREPIRYHILLDPASGEFDPCLFYGAEMVTGYDPVLSARYKTFSGVDEAGRSFIASLLDPQDQTLDLLNTRYVFAPSSMRFDQSRWRETGARSEAKAYRDFRILENLRPAPRAWLIDRVKVAYEGDQLKLIRGELAGGSFDPRATALVDHETAATLNPSLLAAPAEGEEGERKAEIIERGPTRMLIETDSPKAAILVLSEIAYPGWRVTIDGIGAESLRVNYNLRGVALPEGRHRIEFVYSPVSLKIGAVVSITTALGLLLIIFWDKRRAKVIRDADAV